MDIEFDTIPQLAPNVGAHVGIAVNIQLEPVITRIKEHQIQYNTRSEYQ